jgi:hypothetical protein
MFGMPLAYSSFGALGTEAFEAKQKGDTTMCTELRDRVHANSIGTGGRKLLLSIIALIFALTIYPTKAHAQIIRDLEVTIPFQFHAGDAKLPAGTYVIHTLDNSNLTIMEISNEDGSTSALFEVRDAETNPAPAKSELIFNKYGNRYFLAKVFDESNPNGSSVNESRYEQRISNAAREAQTHVPAHHKG